MRQLLLIALIFGAMPASADDLDDRADAMFRAIFDRDACLAYHADPAAPVRRAFTIGERTITTFEYLCNIGAYNVTNVFLMHSEHAGLRPATFAAPVPDVPETEGGTLGLAGYESRLTLINPEVDQKGRIITREKWRGIGDASSSGVWDLTPDGYVLRRFEIDATFDGKQNPVVVFDLPDEPL